MSSSQQVVDADLMSPVARSALRKVRWRILPLIIVLYLVAYLDRNNVGFAQEELSSSLGLTKAAFGFGAGIFFIGYVLMEIPSNGGMYRWGARRWIARILISWGLAATGMALIQGETSFYVVRFILGAAEAGLFPAVLFYLTIWIPNRERVAVLGMFILAQPVANAIGAPLSTAILGMHGIFGLHGWQWLFIIEGIPAILLGVIVPFIMTDRPSEATWLSDDERTWLVNRISAEDASKTVEGKTTFLEGLKDKRAWIYGLLNFGMVCGIYGLSMWLPTIMDGITTHSKTVNGWLVATPYAVAVPFVYIFSKVAARTGQRALVTSMSLYLAALGLFAAGFLYESNTTLAFVALCCAAIGIFGATAPFLSMPSALFVGAAAAASLGLVNTIGNLGGFASPYIVGVLIDKTGSNVVGLIFLSGCLIVTATIVFFYSRPRPEGTGDTLSMGDISSTGVTSSTGSDLNTGSGLGTGNTLSTGASGNTQS